MISFKSFAQVESTAFNLLLKTMLKESVPTISVQALAEKGTDQFLLLDAREKPEYAVSHLKDARWVGFETFDAKSLKDVPKDKPIVVYCSIGVRSEKVGEKLKAAGFEQVENLYGSIFEWVNEGHPVYDSQGKQTEKVHAYNRKWGIWLNKGEKVYD
ncbi:rhodanese-like domain-containing protein [Marinilongibacter aquaticus]|uniref:rhodanese-like domain-containing protein n=1 Tax=Marinilongibacter aquaticus TaxID=2975157 RepID=UPI0021BD3906|nr:rhodanese-like domain-containing protein [Marinilongibacter aquaticus]UBM57918.1 rhodanese-like domain-containing protein [Marinilongibacter aquaticus]